MTKEDFLTILNTVKENIKKSLTATALSKLSETDFEELFKEELERELAGQLAVDYKRGSTIFPDIGCAPFGVEIKTTQADKWVCLGNSIMEGTRREDVKEIFLAFLKKGGDPDIRVGEYNNCISDIKVTHSPRYEVNMNIQNDQTIFAQLGIPYTEFKDDLNKIQRLREYYKTKGVESWWLDEETGETTTAMELESFGELSREKKNQFLIELFALFPEMLNKQYGAAATYLISRYGIYDKSFRDKISAGGRENILINGQTELISQSVAQVIRLLPLIVEFIQENTDLMTQQWGVTPHDFVGYWFNQSEFYLSQSNDIAKPSITLLQVYENSKRL